jgi:hypothetical protein
MIPKSVKINSYFYAWNEMLIEIKKIVNTNLVKTKIT